MSYCMLNKEKMAAGDILLWIMRFAGLYQVNLTDVSIANVTFGETDDDMKKFKSAFLLFCQGNNVSVTSIQVFWIRISYNYVCMHRIISICVDFNWCDFPLNFCSMSTLTVFALIKLIIANSTSIEVRSLWWLQLYWFTAPEHLKTKLMFRYSNNIIFWRHHVICVANCIGASKIKD